MIIYDVSSITYHLGPGCLNLYLSVQLPFYEQLKVIVRLFIIIFYRTDTSWTELVPDFADIPRQESGP